MLPYISYLETQFRAVQGHRLGADLGQIQSKRKNSVPDKNIAQFFLFIIKTEKVN